MSADTVFDVAIAGGGIIGAACALACVQRGLSVALVERRSIGSGATAAGMGHIVVMDDSEAHFALTRYSQQLWQSLATSLSGAAEYEQRGTIWIAADKAEMELAESKASWLHDHSVPCQLLTQTQLRQLEPALRDGLAGGLLVPEDAIVYSPAVAQELASRAADAGARILVGPEVKAIGSGSIKLSNGTEIAATRVINALGSSAVDVTPHLPIRRRKGHLAIADGLGHLANHQLVELGYIKSAHSNESDSVAFNIQPRRSGQLLIGASRQYGADHAEVDAPVLSAMLEQAAQYLPALTGIKPSHVRTGFRAATPDKLPLIGFDVHDPFVLLATGHEGLGITTSLATAELIADLLTGTQSSIASEPYSPARFASAPKSIERLSEE